MSQRPVSCPGCMYSGQPHLVGCENYERYFFDGAKRLYEWKELTKAINSLNDDEVPVVTAYVKRLIESRPKESNKS